MYELGRPLGSYEAPPFTVDPSCISIYQTFNYTNTVSANSGFIQNNSGDGKLVSYETIDVADVSFYTITISGTNICTQASFSYQLEVQEGCMTTTSFIPSTV